MDNSKLQQYQEETFGLDDRDFLTWSLKSFGGRLSFASSLGAEDQVLLHLLEETLSRLELPTYTLEAFTLDTGRLPQESYNVLQVNRKKFNLPLRIYFPDTTAVESMVENQGINGFYQSLENRKSCCAVRKIGPLKRALGGKAAWMTGLRKTQAVTRGDLQRVEWDEAHGLFKLNPLAQWTTDDVWNLIRTQGIPYNALHDRGFPSIGCEPCTRAVNPGEDERSGRWWWESPEHKECGLHVKDSGVKKFNFQTITK
ncbi:MAG: phosphoadenosine phosphosulfate reductase [Spirochaetes bacterium GWB1_48_6]|nr:MAG: phosphoadenosine phosphosulfate reductase [Spirochaetes bacterium GWB1_48_6]